jgi:hypothetical protein
MKRFALAFALPFVACGDASFHVKMPEGFHDAHRTVSVVGVYREGRWSPDYFAQLEPSITGALGRGCEPGYGDALRASDPGLYDEIDEASRQEGVTEDVVARFTPAALGDTLMVLQVYGPMPLPSDRGRSTPPPVPTAARPGYSRGAGGMSGRGPQAGPADPRGARGPDVLIAATLFSTKDHAYLGEVALTYTGKDVDAALKRFGERLAQELRGATCAAWKWPAPATP